MAGEPSQDFARKQSVPVPISTSILDTGHRLAAPIAAHYTATRTALYIHIFLFNFDLRSGVVQDFKSLKEYAVDATHTCQSYCPIDPEDAPLTRLGYGENATDEGATTIAGHQVEDIFWRVAIPILNLTVQESHFYTDISSPFSRSNAGPVLEADSIGFGSEQLIHQNASYDQVRGLMPSSKTWVACLS